MDCRVLVAEDYQLVRQGLRALLEMAGHQVVGEACDGREACELARSLQPDIVLLDLSMPRLNGLEATREILRISPGTNIILLTVFTERHFVMQALAAGAKGYVLKSETADDLLRAINSVLRNTVYISSKVVGSIVDATFLKGRALGESLTSRELQVLQLVAEGRTTKALAGDLHITFKTAESHRNRIMQKLNIHHTAGLVRYAVRRGIISA